MPVLINKRMSSVVIKSIYKATVVTNSYYLLIVIN